MKPVAFRAYHQSGETTAKRNLLNAFGRLPDTMLHLVVYYDEARPDGWPFRDLVDGRDHYVAWDGPDGLKFFASNDPVRKIEAEFPGCTIKLGVEIAWDDFKEIDRAAVAAVEPP